MISKSWTSQSERTFGEEKAHQKHDQGSGGAAFRAEKAQRDITAAKPPLPFYQQLGKCRR